MRRPTTALWLLLTAGCAAPETGEVSAFGGGSESLVPPPAPAVEVAPPRTEAELRNDLATGGDPVGAALALVALFDVEERLPESLLVIASAATRAGEVPPLMAARAGVLRDLGRRREAAEILHRLQREQPRHFGAGLWLELAELEYLEGRREAAGEAMRQLRAQVEAGPFVQAHDFEIRTLEQSIALAAPARSVRVRDLLGDLRGAEDPARRVLVFRLLHEQGGEAASRAACIAVGDPDARVRSAGVAAAAVDRSLLPDFCAKALSDPESPVREAGARRCAALPRDEAATLLLPVLASERDAIAFSAEHEVLRELFGTAEPLSPAAALDEGVRKETVAFWQERFAR